MKVKSHKLKLIIFDLDGTILNLPINYNDLRQELKMIFKPFNIEIEFQPILDSIDFALSIVKRDQGVQKFEEVSMTVYKVLENHEMNAAKQAKAISGAKETLNKLSQLGINLAIFSRTGKTAVMESLTKSGLQKYFSLIIGRDDVKQQKPSAEGIEKILRIIQLKPQQAIMVGDHIFDVIAARKVGMKSIVVQGGKNRSDDFREAGAGVIVNDISEIVDKIDL